MKDVKKEIRKEIKTNHNKVYSAYPSGYAPYTERYQQFIMKKKLSDMELHSAGATVRHTDPFPELTHFESDDEMTKDFIDKWVRPFYMFGINKPDEFSAAYQPIRNELSENVIEILLGYFNWRTRIVGAYFCAIERIDKYIDIIGVHLLKSQVCYAGNGYCLALAAIDSHKSVEYLEKYLDYYLRRKDLHFDQISAFAALSWLGKRHAKDYLSQFEEIWDEFSVDLDDSKLDERLSAFDQQMLKVKRIRTAGNNA